MVWRMVSDARFFPAVLILLSVAASARYGWGGDGRRAVYWIAAAVLQAAVTF